MVCGPYTQSNTPTPFFAAAPLFEHVINAVIDEGKTKGNSAHNYWRFNDDASFPRTDIVESDSALTLYAELPGLKQSDIFVNIADGKLSINGTVPEPSYTSAEGNHVRLRGRKFGDFKRVVPLPRGVKAEHVSAVLKDGLLKVTLQKPVEEPESVPVQIGEDA